MRTKEALAKGIHRRTLYTMRDQGDLDRLSRGVFRLAEMPQLGMPDVVSVCMRVPHAVVCLISSLSFHKITTQIPHMVHIAVERKSFPPTIDHPPTKVYRFPKRAHLAGINKMTVDGFEIKVYSPEKTIADCFKHRNKIGLDVAIEALKLYRERKKVRVNKLLEYARICRVEKVMRPYLEAIL